MHGQKRSEYKSRLLHAESAKKLATKAQQWNHLSHELLTLRRRLDDDAAPPDAAADTGCAAAGGGSGLATKPSPELLLTLTEKMLSVNPDPSHLWNIRRDMLLRRAPPVPTAAGAAVDGDGAAFEVSAELALTAHCLRRNPKSYAAWYQRKWSLVYFVTHLASDGGEGPVSESAAPARHVEAAKLLLQAELGLCAEFLQLDERNFHCWNFRRFVVGVLGSCGGTPSSAEVQDLDAGARSDMELFNGSWSPWLNLSKVMMGGQLSKSILPTGTEDDRCISCIGKSIVPLSKQELNDIITDEWDFTSSKIQDNFSNGSAFHYRSKLLPLVLETRLSSSVEGDEDQRTSERNDAILVLAREEWEDILLNAVFTEPDDQTPWWYHRFIVSWAQPSTEADREWADEFEALLFDMAASLRELLEVEKEHDTTVPGDSRDESKGAKCKWAYIGLHLVLSTLLESTTLEKDMVAELKEEAEECLTGLTKIDPDRRERYHNLATELNGA